MPIRVTPQSRSFCFAFTIAWLVVIVSIFIYGASQRYDDVFAHTSTNSTEPTPPCRIQFFDADQCHFVQNHCSRIDNLGLIPYLKWYYCASSRARAGLVVALILWLVVVFAGMATAADKFLAINLASLVHSLQISENLAGVTIFAFGNGSSDLFSTLAAMNGGNGSLAIAELFGAAAFITTMVLGAIMILQPFQVDQKSFIGDVICFLVAASVNLILISDGKLEIWESFVIVGLYVSFVAFVLVRDRRKKSSTVIDSVHEDDVPEDVESIPLEVEETTALMRNSSDMISYISAVDEPKSDDTSSKTIVMETITEGDSSNPESDVSEVNELASINDWASEYEHDAEVPPFIKLYEGVRSLHIDSITSLLSTLIRLPATIMVGLTTITQPEIEHATFEKDIKDENMPETGNTIIRAPERHPKEYWLLCAQLILGSQFLTWIFWSHAGTFELSILYIGCAVVCGLSLVFLAINRKVLLHPGPKLHVILSTTGFLTATAWIYVLASEAVALIETLGVISDVSDALLGATVFAIGNSSDDIFANISVAKRGHPVLASAACLGGPMLNTLLGIGFGSLIQIARGHYRPYIFHVPASLFVSAASLLIGLSVVLAYVLFRGGKLDKILGYGLMMLWVGFTAANVYVSTRG